MADPQQNSRPVALVTGVSRSIGIGAAVASALREDGWDVVTAGLRSYDDRMPWGSDDDHSPSLEVDLSDPEGPAHLFDRVTGESGPVRALVMCHTESVDSSLLDTTIESFDRHMSVNARATWLLIKSFAEQFQEPAGTGRIIAITSDHTAFNLPYGASKGAMDRIVLAAAAELAMLGITANVVNPGATDTGWMTDEVRRQVEARNLQPRVGTADDCARLVRFLCSEDGAWINGQLLFSNGGIHTP